MKRALTRGGTGHSILDPVLDLLLAHGNVLAEEARWISNPTGYLCVVGRPIDFALIEQAFEIPSSVELVRDLGIIDYGRGTAIIRQA